MDQSAYWQQPQHGTHSHFQHFSNSNQYQNQNYPQYDPNNRLADHFHPSNQAQQQNTPSQQPHDAQQVAGSDWENTWGWGEEDNPNFHSTPQQHQSANDFQNFNSNSNITEDTFTNDESWNWSLDDTPKSSAQSVHNKDKTSTRSNEATNSEQFPYNRNQPESTQWPEQSSDKLQHEINSNYLPPNSAASNLAMSSFSDIPFKQELQTLDGDSFVNQDALENEEIVPNSRREFQNARTLQPAATPPLKFNTSQPSSFTSFSQASAEDLKNPYRHASSKPKYQSANVSSSFQLYNQSVNLEAPPDNSERPDQAPPRTTIRKTATPLTSATQQWQENNEVPISDRNQYLETGRLSSAEAPADTQHDNNDTPPPPGLRRMVPGQLEQDGGPGGSEPPPGLSRMVPGQTERGDDVSVANQGFMSMEPPVGLTRMVPGQMESSDNGNSRSDQGYNSMEPPVGLTRMVPGQTQTNESSNTQMNQGFGNMAGFNPIEPPEGLHRMVPGESSSPESTSRQQQYQPDLIQNEPEFMYNQVEQRSAMSGADGADTPPASVPFPTPMPVSTASSRPERVGADNASSVTSKNSDNRQRSQTSDNRSGRVGASSSSARSKESNKTHDLVQKNENDDHTNVSDRHPVEGQTQETISSIVNAIRNLTVGENVNDEISSSDKDVEQEPTQKHSSLQESSGSEPELRAVGREHRDHKDKRYRTKYEKNDRSDRKRADNYEKDPYKERRQEHERSRHSPEPYKVKDKKQRNKLKDRKYDEDSDYSDREKDRRSRDEKGRERNYHSLQRDKERRRKEKERDYEYMEREYNKKGYYYRYEGESLNESMSRASSRSDSVHNPYRDRGYEGHHRSREHRYHEKDKHRRYRDPYGPYLQGFAYDPYSQYYQQYQYYEQMRRTNPQAYSEWYRKYYQQHAGQGTYDGEDRGSVHSGRSSANETAAKDRFGHTFEQPGSSVILDDTMTSQRLTPAKFATAHVKASISSGRLIRVLPHYPLDGQSPVVEVCNMDSLFMDEEFQELVLFPGPLVRGSTHKKTIIEYCENKMKAAAYNNIVDADSYVLLWELLILLIRQNGMVVGADIAELLLKNRTYEPLQRASSVASSISSTAADLVSEGGNQHSSEAAGGSTLSVLKESDITNKFRDYLLYGSVKEALEWAMKNGLWGHALFLASKLDKRTYANVITRFANGLSLNDPLQTLYQLLSGRTPSVVTCIADDKWGDWRPHLAMILSNTTQHPELNCRAVTTLGDTLFSKGCIYAAQFCYLMAEVGFGSYGDETSKFVLLGGDHSKPFEQFATNEAIHMTEIYEYACSLNNPEFVIPNFQLYKYLLATRLADCGMLDKSLAYLEKIAGYIIQNASSVDAKFVNNVYNLSDRLKYNDVLGDADEENYDENLDANRPDKTWLKDLRNFMYNDSVNSMPQYEVENASNQYDPNQQMFDPMSQQTQQSWQEVSHQYNQQQQSVDPQLMTGQGVESLESQLPSLEPQIPEYTRQEPLWSNQNQQWQQENQYRDDLINYQQDANKFEPYYGSNVDQIQDSPRKPQISMPNQSKSKQFDEELVGNDTESPSSPVKPKPEPTQQIKSEKSSTGWFGGIFSRLAPKPRNQMKLPDDKNPTIVWDPVKKRWVNNDDDGSGAAADLKPPPKMTDLPPRVQTPKPSTYVPPNIPDHSNNPLNGNQPFHGEVNRNLMTKQGSAPKTALGGDGETEQPGEPKIQDPNMFRLQGRGRNLKKSYVDVFNPGRKVGGPQAPVSDPLMSTGIQQPNFFIPQPVNDPNAPADFLTPSVPFSDSTQGERGQYQ